MRADLDPLGRARQDVDLDDPQDGPRTGDQRRHQHAEVADPAGTIWITDSNNIELWQDPYHDTAPLSNLNGKGTQGGEPAFSRHSSGFNTVHADGHVKYYRAGSSKPHHWTIQDDRTE